jgi:transposase
MREGLPEKLRPSIGRNPEEARMQIYTGLDLSRKRLDWHACRGDGTLVGAGAVAPDPDGLAKLVHRLDEADVLAVVESMNGARFIHDRLELAGWDVRLADPLRARALAPLACKTDRVDCWVLAELARRDLIPEVWLPDPDVRAERERARFRLHLVKHRTMLKNRIHQTLIAHGHARARRARSPSSNASCAGSAPTTATCRSCALSPGSPGCSRTRSPPRSARSAASQAHAS